MILFYNFIHLWVIITTFNVDPLKCALDAIGSFSLGLTLVSAMIFESVQNVIPLLQLDVVTFLSNNTFNTKDVNFLRALTTVTQGSKNKYPSKF